MWFPHFKEGPTFFFKMTILNGLGNKVNRNKKSLKSGKDMHNIYFDRTVIIVWDDLRSKNKNLKSDIPMFCVEGQPPSPGRGGQLTMLDFCGKNLYNSIDLNQSRGARTCLFWQNCQLYD